MMRLTGLVMAAALQALAVSHFDGGRVPPVHRLAPVDANGDRVVVSADYPAAISLTRTCGQCHDVGAMRGGSHFRTGATNDAPVRCNREPWFRVNATGGVDIVSCTNRGGMTAWQWTKTFGLMTPGGGLGDDPAAVNEAGGEGSRWFVTGPLEKNCLACHQTDGEYDRSEWARQTLRENWSGAAVAAAGLARVEGMNARLDAAWDAYLNENKDDHLFKVPENIVYDRHKFDDKGRCVFKIGRPKNENCLACHAASEAGVEARMIEGDVHLRGGMKCIDCHSNGMDHRIGAKSCKACHMAAEGAGPKPKHVGIPLVHFERLSCAVCHSGVTRGGKVAQVRTARANRIGIYGKARWATDVPFIEEPFFRKMGERGKVKICRRAKIGPGAEDCVYWPFYHDIRPARMARGSRPGLCADCHSAKSGFFDGWEKPLYFSTFNLAFAGRPLFKIVLWVIFGFLCFVAVAAAAAGLRRFSAKTTRRLSAAALWPFCRFVVVGGFVLALAYLTLSGVWGWVSGGMTNWPLMLHMVAGGAIAGAMAVIAVFGHAYHTKKGSSRPLFWALWLICGAALLFTAVMPMMTVFGMEGQLWLLWAHRISAMSFLLASIALVIRDVTKRAP